MDKRTTVDEYFNAGGYGIFCGKKCVERKKAAGIPPKWGKKNKAAFEQEMLAREEQRRKMQEQASGGSTGLIIGGVALLAVAGIAIYIIRKKRAKG